jgi:uncharacterized protein (DUF2267 family)
MGYHSVIKMIKRDARISEFESEEAVGRLVEEITERLEFDDQMMLARELPTEFQDIVYAVAAVPEELERDKNKDIFVEFMEKEAVMHDEAQEQVVSAWFAIKPLISGRLVRHFRAHLPAGAAQMLA